MKRHFRGAAAATLLVASLLCASPSAAYADGCLITSISERHTANLAQSRQEVMMVLEGGTAAAGAEAAPKVTYILGSQYTGDAADLVWVIPTPATPENVSAHLDDRLFRALAEVTAPSFYIPGPARYQSPCGCASAGDASALTTVVEVEASGRAGAFDWTALTSGGGAALVDWLSEHGYGVPPEAAPVLQPYIDQGWHFLALRIQRPLAVLAVAARKAIPPIQFTCETNRRVYPLAISRISAAGATELLVYIVADHRAQAGNAPNATIAEGELALDSANPSGTTYEDVFAARIAALGGPAAITEWSALVEDWTFSRWSGTGIDALQRMTGRRLTRLRTVLGSAQMDRDLEFVDAPADAPVAGQFYVGDAPYGAAAFGGPGLVVGMVGMVIFQMKRRRRLSGGAALLR
ncbi:MAG: DUF2330 domain-containing protein [Planctomycetota bacterium]